MAILLSLSCCCYLLQYSASSFCESSRPLWPTVAHAFSVAPIRSRNEAPPIVSFRTYTNNIHIANNIKGSSRLYSLKPAAIPLMDCGKALARSGELLIDLTTSLDIYGGSLSAMGANVRNCGDCLAQAAASCRFKTGVELVTDELREGERTILLQLLCLVTLHFLFRFALTVILLACSLIHSLNYVFDYHCKLYELIKMNTCRRGRLFERG